MMAIVPKINSGSGLRKFQADVFLLDRAYKSKRFKSQLQIKQYGRNPS